MIFNIIRIIKYNVLLRSMIIIIKCTLKNLGLILK